MPILIYLHLLLSFLRLFVQDGRLNLQLVKHGLNHLDIGELARGVVKPDLVLGGLGVLSHQSDDHVLIQVLTIRGHGFN